jgi:hypothetical protein
MGTKFQTPAAIAKMLRPVVNKPQGRKVWSIDLETVWIPFFTASNTVGDTQIPNEALGAPLLLSKDNDGTIRFNDAGRQVLRVNKDLSKAVADVRQNIIAELMNYPQLVYKAKPQEYQAQLEANHKAGQPILDKMAREITEAQIAKATAEAPAEQSPTETPAQEKEPVAA